jgi:hypothetical protein
LLDTLGTTPAERQAILRGYIKPTEKERAEGLEVPTEAHRAIARLAAGASIRVSLVNRQSNREEHPTAAIHDREQHQQGQTT